MAISKNFNNLMRTMAITATVLSVLVGANAVAADDRVRLNFGVYSSNKPTAMVRTFKPILNALENSMAEKLGRDVDIRMQIAKNYEQGIADLTNGKVDFSRFGPASYVEAKRENQDLEILAMEAVDSAKVFYGIIAVKSDSDITDIKQLKNRSFAFGAESSTIGRYLSQLYLEGNGIRAGDLSDYEYLGRHDKVGTAVGAGDFDAGALNESTFKKLTAKGEPIRELARFPNVTKPWIARKGLQPEVFAALQNSLLELKDGKGLKALKVNGFLPGGDEDYLTIRNSMEFNDRFFQEPLAGAALSVEEAPITEDGTDERTTMTSTQTIQINIQFESEQLARDLQNAEGEPIVVNVMIGGVDGSRDPSVSVTQVSSEQ